MHCKQNRQTAVVIFSLLLAAAALITWSRLDSLRDPSGNSILWQSSINKPDIFNIQLNWLESITAPVMEQFPPDVAFRYVGQEDLFPYFQAVLAPRKIGPDVESPFILAYDESGLSMMKRGELRDARLLFRLSGSIAIFQREGLR